MSTITHLVDVVSACKTYKETLKCTSEAEANGFAEQIRADGGTATVKPATQTLAEMEAADPMVFSNERCHEPPKTQFHIRVTDARGKYPPKVYTVEAGREFEAYGPATQQFIKDNNHPPYKPGQRQSVYFARFQNQRVPANPDGLKAPA